MRRTFILHASGAKLPTDLLGLTSVRYEDATTAAEVKAVCQKLRKAIEDQGALARIEGLWWQYSLTECGPRVLRGEPAAGSRETVPARWRSPGARGGRTAACPRDIGAKRQRRRRSRRASSTTGRENDPGTRTRLSWTGPGRSDSSPPIAPPVTSRPVRTGARSECADIRRAPARRSRGRERRGRKRRAATRGPDRGADQGLEIDQGLIVPLGGAFDGRRRPGSVEE